MFRSASPPRPVSLEQGQGCGHCAGGCLGSVHPDSSWPSYLYAPLKVLVCYLFPRGTSQSYLETNNMLGWFKHMHDRACAFHPRSADDACLLIIGRRGAEKPSDLNWQGYQITGQDDLRE